jgi:hypothetical protein
MVRGFEERPKPDKFIAAGMCTSVNYSPELVQGY